MDKSKILKTFERYVFQGVPERPEPTFERDEYTNHTIRLTGQSNTPRVSEVDDDLHNIEIIGFIKDDFDNQVESFIPFDDKED